LNFFNLYIAVEKRFIIIMIDFKKRFGQFINEARRFEMRISNYVECNANFAKITPVKGLVAKIIKAEDRLNPKNNNFQGYYTLQFEVPLIDRRGDEPIESNIIEINSNQLKNLKVINGKDYERIRAGHTLQYQSSAGFETIMRLLKFKKSHNFYDASYFDIDDNGNISMLPSNKAQNIPESERYTSKQRQQTKISRVIRKLNDTLSEQQVEKIGLEFNAMWKQLYSNIGDRIRVVTGKDITYWYNEINYYKTSVNGGGSLNKSCMRYSNAQSRVAFYSRFPDKIALCILLDDTKTKLLARALVWKLDLPKDEIFMDRIYYVTQEHEAIMAAHAGKMGWKSKIGGYNFSNKLFIELPYNAGEPLPYLDTLKWNSSNGFRN